MLKCQDCARGLLSQDRGETETLKPETEAKTKTFSLEAEGRPRRLKFQPRRDRAETTSVSRRQDRGHIPASFRKRAKYCTVQYNMNLYSAI